MTHFERVFHIPPSTSAEAPGRVNLIGEHTDYNDGFVLPTAIPQKTRVTLSTRSDRSVIAISRNFESEEARCEYELGSEKPRQSWTDYLQGVTSVLQKAGHRLGGFQVVVDSQVPMGSGLSSSAALEVSLFRALREAFGLSLDDVVLAQLCQRVENEFVGARVGIMDPMACSLAELGTALFLDTRQMTHRTVSLPDDVELVVINSGISHRNVGGDYNTRRGECEEACRLLGIGQLRELGVGDLAKLQRLPDVLKRRARHVITENQRVLDAVAAMERGDSAALGKLFLDSHASMRDDYEVSIPEIDALVAITAAQSDVFGARLTGGGFGGSIVALVKKGSGARIAKVAAVQYEERFRIKPTVLVPVSAD